MKEWHASPIITTLDSIAAPIKLIQFPTVTVCQEEFHPLDQWAGIENILNFVALECTDYVDVIFGEYGRYFPACNDTVKVRKDFEFLISSVIDYFEKELKDKYFAQGSNFSTNVIINGLLELVNQGKITVEELSNLPLKYFSKEFISLSGFYKDLDKYSQRNSSNAVENTNATDETKIQIKIVQELMDFLAKDFYMMSSVDGQNMRLGSFLAHFIHLKKFLSFEPTNLFYDEFFENSGCEYDEYEEYNYEFHEVKFCCNALDENELFLHEYFSSLSTLFGLSNNISLFDVPSILANIDVTKNIMLTKHQPFVYTRCQKEDELQFFPFVECVKEWDTYLLSKDSKKFRNNLIVH